MNNDELILKELREIKERLSKLERSTLPFGPIHPVNPLQRNTQCSKCGIKLEGLMGYCCPRGDCPTGMGPVMC